MRLLVTVGYYMVITLLVELMLAISDLEKVFTDIAGAEST
jgi:hypothetical protein